MNPNELADKLEKDGEGCTCAAYCAAECACDANWAEYHTKAAATMLRQQQAQIELLEAKRMVAYNIGYEDAMKAAKQ
jgi:hydroxymethylpyrimidine/phosphomethylpyrimidine kinase